MVPVTKLPVHCVDDAAGTLGSEHVGGQSNTAPDLRLKPSPSDEGSVSTLTAGTAHAAPVGVVHPGITAPFGGHPSEIRPSALVGCPRNTPGAPAPLTSVAVKVS